MRRSLKLGTDAMPRELCRIGVHMWRQEPAAWNDTKSKRLNSVCSSQRNRRAHLILRLFADEIHRKGAGGGSASSTTRSTRTHSHHVATPAQCARDRNNRGTIVCLEYAGCYSHSDKRSIHTHSIINTHLRVFCGLQQARLDAARLAVRSTHCHPCSERITIRGSASE